MADIDNSAILLKSDFRFKGPLTENFVLQQLKTTLNTSPRYYSTGDGEIDFIIQQGTEIIPIEVKAWEEKSAPSFKAYIRRHQPGNAFRISKLGYVKDGSFTNLPLYLTERLAELMQDF